MRTKTLILAAALSVAAVASSMAQSNVYSLNVVGYVNVTIPADKYAIVATPLNFTGVGGNAITNVLGGTIEGGTTVYPFANGLFQDAETYFAGFGWFPGTTVLNPGAAYFVKTPSSGGATLTMVGEVLQGNQTNALSTGYSLVGSQVPQSVPLGDWNTSQATTMHFPAAGGDSVARYNVATQTYFDSVTYFDGYGWFDASLGGGGPIEGPSPAVAEGFFVSKASGTNWVRNFTVQ